MAYQQPVAPHVVNVEAAGFEPADVSARIESFSFASGRGAPGASR